MGISMKDFFATTPMFSETKNHILYEIKKPLKFGGLDSIIKCETPEIKTFISELEKNENIVYWNYKSVFIQYFNVYDNDFSVYSPDFHIITSSQKDISSDDDIKIEEFLLDIHPYQVSDIPLLTVDDLQLLPKKDQQLYEQDLAFYNSITAAYKAAHDYAKKRGMNFYLYTPEQGYLTLSTQFFTQTYN